MEVCGVIVEEDDARPVPKTVLLDDRRDRHALAHPHTAMHSHKAKRIGVRRRGRLTGLPPEPRAAMVDKAGGPMDLVTALKLAGPRPVVPFHTRHSIAVGFRQHVMEVIIDGQ